MRPFVCLLIPLSTLAGCLDEPATSESVQAETVLEQPTPFASCNQGCGDGHVVGEPVRVYTSFEGLCKQGWEYSCLEQDYDVTVTCSGACTSGGTHSFHGSGGFDVVPMETGPLTITVHFTRGVPVFNDEEATESTTRTVNGGTSYVPDRIAIECTQGHHGLPCSTTTVNYPPIDLDFTLFAGTKRLNPTKKFFVDSAAAGELNWNGQEWWTHEGGQLEATAWYGAIESEAVRLDVAYMHPPRDYVGDASDPEPAN